ncbi:short chain dehydrogenase [Streptomyces sp. NBC_01304]|uniref:short chain dehydrogenase n=1 Tax=Streptomyces sp. NBC_01304 TaxID=2903818 RepID=UPI002E135148|nr:short chain dehydrogenase [Streptomyces sp. NBC_01304]
MRILLVGASGTLGTAVRGALSRRHEVVAASRNGGDVTVDITDPQSITAMYQTVGTVDAVACAAGTVTLKPFAELDREDLEAGIRHKLLGQVELVRQGVSHVSATGSFTLITSVLSHDPVPGSTAAALVSGALKAFVVAAAIELPHRQRINAVSPSVFTTSLPRTAALFPGAKGVLPEQVAQAYVKSVEGAQTGQVYRVEEQF